jgi:hypothetical protein
MSFFKTADLKIKEVITNEIQLSDFNNRKAKALNTIDAGKVESTRHVTAIEPNACYVVTVGLHGSSYFMDVIREYLANNKPTLAKKSTLDLFFNRL